MQTLFAVVLLVVLLVLHYLRTKSRIVPLDYSQTPHRTLDWDADAEPGVMPGNYHGWHDMRTPIRSRLSAHGSQKQHALRRIAASRGDV